MSALNLSLSVLAVPVQCICFAPFVKGGYGGFALGMIEEREQIPLNPPFQRGRKSHVASLLDFRVSLKPSCR